MMKIPFSVPSSPLPSSDLSKVSKNIVDQKKEAEFEDKQPGAEIFGVSPQGRHVSWFVSADKDVASLLTQAIEEASSVGLGQVIAKELGLGPASGKPILSRTIDRAFEMTRIGAQVLEGVDFVTCINLSAKNDTAGFRRVCERANIKSSSLSEAIRASIDADMSRRFDDALRAGASPVSTEQAQEWLVQVIQSKV